MISYVIDTKSVDETVEYLETIRQRIFEQVRLGMAEAMDGLGATAIQEMAAAGIQNRSGKLAAGFERHSIRENRNAIVGLITPKRDMKIQGRTFPGFVATALDKGFRVPEVSDKLLQFSAPNESTLYSRGHVAFDVAPHPFMRAASERFAPTLIDIIRERVTAATEAA